MIQSSISSAALADDRPCIGCGYNLRGASPDGACPECGLSVRRSLMGESLAFANPVWLRKLTWGAGIVAAERVLSWSWSLALNALLEWTNYTLSVAVHYVSFTLLFGVYALGYWLLTSPEPGCLPRHDPKRLRWFIRIGLLGVVPVLFVLGALLNLWQPNIYAPMIALWILNSIADMAVFGALLWLLRRLALRDGRPFLAAMVFPMFLLATVVAILEIVGWILIVRTSLYPPVLTFSKWCAGPVSTLFSVACYVTFAIVFHLSRRHAQWLELNEKPAA